MKILRHCFTILIFLCAPFFSTAKESLHAQIEKGNQHYSKQEYQRALKAYKKTDAKENVEAVPIVNYNMASAKYHLGNYEEALEDFRGVYSKEHPAVNAASQFNIGCALYRQAEQHLETQEAQPAMEKLQQAVGSFRQQLVKNPEDQDLRYNYCQARRKLKELQQQQPEQKEQQDDSEKEDEQQDQQDKEKKDDKGESQDQQNQEQQDQKQNESEQQNQDQQQQQNDQQESKATEQKKQEVYEKEMALSQLKELFEGKGEQKPLILYQSEPQPNPSKKDW